MALGTLNYSRISDLAYQELRDAILSGQLERAARLNQEQEELARRLGVSRAPVRDALNRLEAEGHVKTLSRTGGVVVANASEQEMVSIYELRAILDTASTRLACERMSDAHLTRLRDIVDETERVTQANDVQAIVQAHAQFHSLIYAACGNPELTRVAQNLWDRSYRYRVLALSNAENARRGLAQHRGILAALQARDLQGAIVAAEAHDQATIRHLRGRMQPGEDHPQPGPDDAAVDTTHGGGAS